MGKRKAGGGGAGAGGGSSKSGAQQRDDTLQSHIDALQHYLAHRGGAQGGGGGSSSSDDAAMVVLLTEAEQFAIRGLMKTLHEALVPESKERVHRHLIIQEGPMEANNPLLRLAPNATSILSCQELVNVIASYLNRPSLKGGYSIMTRTSTSNARLINRACCVTFSKTIQCLRVRADNSRPLAGLSFFKSFPNFVSVTINGTGKGASISIINMLNAMAGPPPHSQMGKIKQFNVNGQTIQKTVVKRFVELAQTPLFSSLEFLHLHWARLEVPSIRELVKAWSKGSEEEGQEPFLPNLRHFGCPLNEKLGDDGIIELLESWEKGLSPTLETLDLSLCGLGTRALMRLVDSMERGTFPRLTHLSLGVKAASFWNHNRCSSGLFLHAFMRALESGACSRLEVIYLEGFSFMTQETLNKFCRGYTNKQCFLHLKTLYISTRDCRGQVVNDPHVINRFKSTFGKKVVVDRPEEYRCFGIGI